VKTYKIAWSLEKS